MPGTQVDQVDMVATALSSLAVTPPYVLTMANIAADLIERQQAEIERLEAQINAAADVEMLQLREDLEDGLISTDHMLACIAKLRHINTEHETTIVEQQATIKRYGKALRTAKYTDHLDVAQYAACAALKSEEGGA